MAQTLSLLCNLPSSLPYPHGPFTLLRLGYALDGVVAQIVTPAATVTYRLTPSTGTVLGGQSEAHWTMQPEVLCLPQGLQRPLTAVHIKHLPDPSLLDYLPDVVVAQLAVTTDRHKFVLSASWYEDLVDVEVYLEVSEQLSVPLLTLEAIRLAAPLPGAVPRASAC